MKLWITDFGLARMEQDAGMTMTGDLLGTLRYMSPEQALAKRVVVDHRSDVYSLGVTLCELLTLQPVYAAEDRQELLRQIAFEEPRQPRQINARIPQDLETIVLKAIEKNPADRYATAQALADDLRAFLENLPVKAKAPSILHRTVKWSRRHRPFVVSVAISSATVLLLSLAVLATSNYRIRKESALTAAALSAKETAETKLRSALQNRNESLGRLLAVIRSLVRRIGSTQLGDLPEMKLLRDELAQPLTARINKSSSNWQDWFSRGAINYHFRDCELAIADLSRAIELKPDDPAPWEVRGLAYNAIGEYQKASDDFTEALRLDPNHWEPCLNRAVALFHLKRWNEAIADYDKVLQVNPNHFGALGERAQAHYALANFDAAVRDYTKAIELAKDQPFRFLFCHRAHCYSLMGRYAEARDDYERAIDLRPNDVDALNNYAAHLASVPVDSLRDGKRAVELATKACELTNYRDATVIDTLAESYAETGDFEQAVRWSEKALELATDDNRAEFKLHLKNFRSGKPWRMKP
jgi:tetratricopeptide (TPR) repeat protein